MAGPLEPLRPTRLSAPVIARLIRSTTTFQELADVVAQQSPYFDTSHISIALLHLALLTARQQRQQQEQQQQEQHQQRSASGSRARDSTGGVGAPSGSALERSSGAGPGGGALTGSGGGRGAATSPTALSATTAAAAAPTAASSPEGGVPWGDSGEQGSLGTDGMGGGSSYEDALEPLTMSSIFDDDDFLSGDGEGRSFGDNHESGQAASTSLAGSWDGGESGGELGDRRVAGRAAAQSAALLDAAAAASPPTAAVREPDPDAPLRVVASGAPRDEGSGSTIGSGVSGNVGGGAGGSISGGGGGGSTSSNGIAAVGHTAAAVASTGRREERINGAAEDGGSPTASSGGGATTAAGATSSSSSSAAAGAATAAPAAARSPGGAVLRALLALVFARLDEMGGGELASVVSALAALRFPDRGVAEQLLQALALRLYECRPQELPNVLASAALLGVAPDPEFRSAFYAAVRSRARSFGPREVAATLWGYGAIGTDVQEDAVLVLLEVSRPRLSYFSPLHLARTAQGLAALRYRPPAEWVDAFNASLRTALRRFGSRELCALLRALASLQLGLDDATRAQLLAHTLSALPSLAPSELALSISALGRLTTVSSGASSPALLDLDASGRLLDASAVALRLGAFRGGELVQLLEGLARLALQPPLGWMEDYVAALTPRLRELDARQLAGVLGSLAAQQYRPQPELQEVVLQATRDNMQQLLSDTTCTASLVTALRRLSIDPPPAWVAALLAASRSALKNRSADLHLANLAASLAAWGVAPDGRWTARLMWRSMVLMGENRMSPRALAALLQAMSSLGLRPNAAWTALCLRCALSRAGHRSFEPQHFSAIMASLAALGVRPPQDWLLRMLLAMYRCWGQFGVSTWSSLLPALVLLQARPPRSWLSRFESASAPRLADCSALQLLALLAAAHQLHQLATATAAATVAAAPAVAVGGPMQSPGRPSAAAAAAATAGAKEAAATAPKDQESRIGREERRARAGRGMAPAPQAPLSFSALLRASPASASSTSAAAASSSARPSAAWMSSWWSASAALLGRMRYAPSELLLTAGWLASLGLRPPPEWLQACADVSARYAKVMQPAEQQQLEAALMPLLGPRTRV